MASLRISRNHLWYVLQLLFLLVQTNVFCYQYQVGDLHGWSIPSAENKNIFAKWSKNHNFRIGDSLFFLYPPSQDSVIQVTKEAYESCNLKDPILKMDDGNSLFNITKTGEFFFTSGKQGNCEKSQKLYVSLLGNGSSSALSPSYGPDALPDSAPSYPTVFGSIPAQSSSSSSVRMPVFFSAVIGLFVHHLVQGNV